MASEKIAATVTEVFPEIGIMAAVSLMHGKFESHYTDDTKIKNIKTLFF